MRFSQAIGVIFAGAALCGLVLRSRQCASDGAEGAPRAHARGAAAGLINRAHESESIAKTGLSRFLHTHPDLVPAVPAEDDTKVPTEETPVLFEQYHNQWYSRARV